MNTRHLSTLEFSLRLAVASSLLFVTTIALTSQARADYEPGTRRTLNQDGTDTRDSLKKVATEVTSACMAEATLTSLSYDLSNLYKAGTVSSARVGARYSGVQALTDNPPIQTFDDLHYSGQTMSFYHTGVSNPKASQSFSMNMTVVATNSIEAPATMTASVYATEYGVNTNLKVSAVLPVIVVSGEVLTDCVIDNWGVKNCKDTVQKLAADLVMPQTYVETATWTNAMTGLQTRKTLDLKDFASCLYWRWWKAKP